MWLSNQIHYRRVKLKYKGLFGWQEVNGYQLTKPLRYKHGDYFLVLNEGYFWNGPSYPNWMEWLVGKRESDGNLASSAMHDVFRSIPARYVGEEDGERKMFHVKLNIKDGAKLYREMLVSWKGETSTPKQARLKELAIKYLLPVINIFSGKVEFELVD